MATQIDPVGGMEVDPDTATWMAEHKGETYYFCGKGCKLEFQDNPEQYLAPDHRPGMPGEPMMPHRKSAGHHH